MTIQKSSNAIKSQLDSANLSDVELSNGKIEEVESEHGIFSKRTGLSGLSSKMLILFVLFYSICEILVVVPYAANYRDWWIMNKFDEINALIPVFDEINTTSSEVQNYLLRSTSTFAIAVKDENARKLIAVSDMPPEIDQTIDMENQTLIKSIIQTLDTIFLGGDRTLSLTGILDSSSKVEFEAILNESALKENLMDFVFKILTFSLFVSIFTGILAYFMFRKLVVKPIVQLADSMKQFADNPQDESFVVQSPVRKDEMGQALRQLECLQRRILEILDQQNHLATMGLSIAKINHDLRNLLAVAQFLFERIEEVSDPTVQHSVPKIQSTLNYAISYTAMILNYGKQKEEPLDRKSLKLWDLVREASDIVLLNCKTDIQMINNVNPDTTLNADHDQLFRVFVNLLKNSIQAMESNSKYDGPNQLKVDASRQGSVVKVQISDTGPGIPEAVRNNLFNAFQTHGKIYGTGLGLTIASDLVQAHGGEINVLDSDAGATFEFWIPDRPADLETAGDATANQNP